MKKLQCPRAFGFNMRKQNVMVKLFKKTGMLIGQQDCFWVASITTILELKDENIGVVGEIEV